MYFKGYEINEAVTPFELNRVYPDREEKEAFYMPEDQVAIFKMVYALCQREGIKLVLFCNPSPVCYDTPMLNGISRFSQEESVDFLDANAEIEKLGIDWETDTYDKGDHLNLNGSRKMTKFLAQYLVQECDLEDHRSDPGYQAWNDLLAVYDEEVRRMEGTSYPILEKKQRQQE